MPPKLPGTEPGTLILRFGEILESSLDHATCIVVSASPFSRLLLPTSSGTAADPYSRPRCPPRRDRSGYAPPVNVRHDTRVRPHGWSRCYSPPVRASTSLRLAGCLGAAKPGRRLRARGGPWRARRGPAAGRTVGDDGPRADPRAGGPVARCPASPRNDARLLMRWAEGSHQGPRGPESRTSSARVGNPYLLAPVCRRKSCASVRRHRRAQRDRSTLRSITPKRAADSLVLRCRPPAEGSCQWHRSNLCGIPQSLEHS